MFNDFSKDLDNLILNATNLLLNAVILFSLTVTDLNVAVVLDFPEISETLAKFPVP